MKFEAFGARYRAQRDAALDVQNQAGTGWAGFTGGSQGWEWNMGPAASGVNVTADNAMRVAAVYACVTRIAGGISTLPCNVYRRTWDATRQEYVSRQVEDAPLWWLLNEQPTDAWTGAQHWEAVTAHRTLRGDHFTEIRRNAKSGTLHELVPMPWGSTVASCQTQDVGSRLMYAVNDGMRVRGVDQDDMLHFPGFGFDGIRGRSVIGQAAHNAAGNAMAMDEYAGKFFAGGAHPSAVLKAPKKMSDDQVEVMQRAFARKYAGLANAHQLPLVLTEGMDIAPLSISAEDSQLLEARKFQVIDIARAFGVPPHMIGETSGSTSWGSGLESMGRMFVMLTLAPHLAVIEQELNRKLCRTASNFLAFDRAALTQGDLAARATYNRAAIGGPGTGPGWKSVNDIRHDDNLPPSTNADDDKLYKPPITPAATPKNPAEETK